MRIALLAVALAGCLAPPARHDDGGQSGVANHPEFCVEDERVAVADPALPADGFAFAAADVIGRVAGAWSGAADLDGTGEIPVTLDVAVGDVVAVQSHLEGGDDTQTEALGAPFESCPPVYEIGLSLAIVASPALSAEVPALWVVASPEGPDLFAGAVPAEDVDGTLQPPEWPEPDLWDRELLSAAFAGEDAAAVLGLDWMAVNDDAEDASGSGSGSGSVSTATVEPSGMNAPIASIPLTQVP